MFILWLPPCTHHPLQQLPCSFTVHREMWHPRIYTSPSTSSCWSLFWGPSPGTLGTGPHPLGPTHPPDPKPSQARAHSLKHPAGVTAICSSSARPCSLLNGSNPPGNVQVEQPWADLTFAWRHGSVETTLLKHVCIVMCCGINDLLNLLWQSHAGYYSTWILDAWLNYIRWIGLCTTQNTKHYKPLSRVYKEAISTYSTNPWMDNIIAVWPPNPQAFLYGALSTFATDFQFHGRWDQQRQLIGIQGVQVTLALSRSFRSLLLTCQEGSCFFPDIRKCSDQVNHLEQKTISTLVHPYTNKRGFWLCRQASSCRSSCLTKGESYATKTLLCWYNLIIITYYNSLSLQCGRREARRESEARQEQERIREALKFQTQKLNTPQFVRLIQLVAWGVWWPIPQHFMRFHTTVIHSTWPGDLKIQNCLSVSLWGRLPSFAHVCIFLPHLGPPSILALPWKATTCTRPLVVGWKLPVPWVMQVAELFGHLFGGKSQGLQNGNCTMTGDDSATCGYQMVSVCFIYLGKLYVTNLNY